MTGGSGIIPEFYGAALEEAADHPEWVPNLKNLLNPERRGKGVTRYMQTMRAFSKQRDKLKITPVSRSEEKKWGDWELIETKEHYKKGRKQSDNGRNYGYRYGGMYL
jgi:hypothetical protein